MCVTAGSRSIGSRSRRRGHVSRGDFHSRSLPVWSGLKHGRWLQGITSLHVPQTIGYAAVMTRMILLVLLLLLQVLPPLLLTMLMFNVPRSQGMKLICAMIHARAIVTLLPGRSSSCTDGRIDESRTK